MIYCLWCVYTQCIFLCRLESELKSMSEQISAAPKQHQLESLQSAVGVAQSSLQQAREQLQQREEAITQINEKLVQVRTDMNFVLYM